MWLCVLFLFVFMHNLVPFLNSFAIILTKKRESLRADQLGCFFFFNQSGRINSFVPGDSITI